MKYNLKLYNHTHQLHLDNKISACNLTIISTVLLGYHLVDDFYLKAGLFCLSEYTTYLNIMQYY